ncbi:glycosyltransferase [Thermoanaerobacteraceae bacterium SP2]|nr:glycosyltransferase [Thermoanaerobacteraceae bacterium SP2]
MPFDIKFIFMTVLAVFGVLYVFQSLIMVFFHKNPEIKHETVIIVKNAQERIEGIVRNFYRHYLNHSDELWIVDGGSSDQTTEILEKLSLTFPGLKVLMLPDLPSKACMQEVLKYIDKPVILFIDLVAYPGHIDDIFFQGQKSVEMGLKNYKN